MSSEQRILRRQATHLICLGILLGGVYAASLLPGFHDGAFLGVDSDTWLCLAIVNATIHQWFVWLCWRTELYWQTLTRLLGSSAFTSYAVVFALLIVARPLLVTALAIANSGTLAIDATISRTAATLLLAPVFYLAYSIHRYFGFTRAMGIDHFDPSYRRRPLVRAGIFRFTSNAMYVFGLLVLWIPALYMRSTAAIAVAAFSHLYIWVHYLCTEKPDMEAIYGGEQSGVATA